MGAIWLRRGYGGFDKRARVSMELYDQLCKNVNAEENNFAIAA